MRTPHTRVSGRMDGTYIFHLVGQFWVCRVRSQRRKLPVVNLVPPSAYSAAERLTAQRSITVPKPPSGECESPQRALDQRQNNLYTIVRPLFLLIVHVKLLGGNST